jgi:uncharacterized protein (DUF3084 family)
MSKQQSAAQQDHADRDHLQKSIYQLLEQISKRDQKIASKDKLLRYTQARLVERETQLARTEAQLNEIVASKTWKTALMMQRIRTFLVPLNSRRSRILERGVKTILRIKDGS